MGRCPGPAVWELREGVSLEGPAEKDSQLRPSSKGALPTSRSGYLFLFLLMDISVFYYCCFLF